MTKIIKSVLFLLFLLLQGCSDYVKKTDNNDSGYFSDATHCFQTSVRKEYVKVPTANTLTIVEVPIGNDENIFGLCMKQSGHPITQADPQDYLNVSRACLQQARNSSKPDIVFAKCVLHGQVADKTFIPGKSK